MTAGDIYTVAGTATGTAGNTGDGGPRSGRRCLSPYGIGTDPYGDLYILQTGIACTAEQLQESPPPQPPAIPARARPGQLALPAHAAAAPGGITVTQPGGAQVTF